MAQLLQGLVGSTGTGGQPATVTKGKGKNAKTTNVGVAPPSVGLSPYAYSQTAPLTNQQLQGMQNASTNVGTANQLYNQYSPLYNQASNLTNQYNPLATQAGALYNQSGNLANQAGNIYGQSGNIYNQTQGLTNPVQNYLGNTMNQNQYMGSGALMSPNSNPYLSNMYGAAAQNLTQQYEQATAPNILQTAAQTGTLGSAGEAQGFQNAQAGLGQGLGNLAANLYGGQYGTDLNATLQAQQQAPGLATAQYTPVNQLQQALQSQEGAFQTQQNALTGQEAALTGQQNVLAGQGNALTNQQNVLSGQEAALTGSENANQQLLDAGQMAQTQQQNVLDTATKNLNAQANWPFQALSMLGQALGTASGGGGQSVTVGSSPMGGAGK